MPSFTKNTPGPLKQSIKTPNEPPNGAPHEPPNGSPHEQPNLAPAGPSPAQQGSPPNSATQPGEAAAPANSTASKGGGFGFLGAHRAEVAGGPEGLGLRFDGPGCEAGRRDMVDGTDDLLAELPAYDQLPVGRRAGERAVPGPNFGAGKKPGQPGNTDPGKQPNAQPGQPGKTDSNQPPTGQPASQPDKIDSNQPPAGRPGPPAKTDGAPDWWDETMQPPNQPDATSEDIAHFKSASEGMKDSPRKPSSPGLHTSRRPGQRSTATSPTPNCTRCSATPGMITTRSTPPCATTTRIPSGAATRGR
ncbi:hypothetical protein [Nannocystis pusilla]|uniref:hypothetical protein n=1 Tax=Nannocystis pusilla TaxID=889268 RepID=UPI003B7630F7